MRMQPLHLLASGCAVVSVLASTSGSTAAPPTQVNAFNEVFNNLSNQVDNHVFTIPAGKRLAIDYLSAKGTVPAGDSVSGVQINNPVVHFIPVVAQGLDISGKSVFVAAQGFHTTIGPFPVPRDVVVRMERKMFGAGTEAALAVTLAGQLLP
jgi:hypothetical protein